MTDTIYAWSQTAASNANSDSTINWAEYQNPSTANDSARAMMARLAELLADLAPTRSSTGSANAYAVTTAAAGSTLRNGEQITFIPNHTNTASCTLNVDGRGAKPWRPKQGTEFVADNILSGVPVTAYYGLADDAWYSAAGYYVSALASGVALQSITARLPQIGDMVLSMDSSPGAGRIRLTESTQSVLKTAYPELNAWLSARSYPWGSTATHFNLPPAAGYVLRFAATSNAIDTSGARAAGSTQADAVLSHTHSVSASGTTSTAPDHQHVYSAPVVTGTAGSGTAVTVVGASTNTLTNAAGSHNHTVPVTGTAAATGIAENRVKNVAYHIDVIASTALAAAQVAVFGFPLQWDTGTTAADPGAGRIRGNDTALASITALYVSTSDGWGVNITDVLTGLDTGNVLHLSKVGAQANRITATVSSTPTAATGYVIVPVTIDLAAGSLSSNDQMAFEYSKGTQGPQGNEGPSVGLDYAWAVATSGDPGSGNILANNVTLSSATAVHMSKTGASGQSFGTYLATWDDSTSTIKGHLSIYTLTDRAEYIEADVTGITDNSTYYTVAISNVAAAGTPTAADTMVVMFVPKGDKGDTGATGATGPTGSTGATGPAWDQWQGAWLTATAYVVNDAVENDGSSYICTSGHTSGAGTEPGTGASWATVWDLVAAKGADGAGLGDVTAASSFSTDNRVIRSDGTGKGVQASGITVNDDDQVSGVATLNGYAVAAGANYSLTFSASGSALTIALKNAAGNDPSTTSPVAIPFRSATATSSVQEMRTVAAATSLVLSSGSTLGVTSSTGFRIWIVAFDDGGTVRLGAILCSTYASSIANIFALQYQGIASSTAEGGAGGADSARVFYTGTAVTTKAYTVLGYAEWGAGGVTAGTWTTTNLIRTEVFGPTTPLPGRQVGTTLTAFTSTGSSVTSTTYTNVTGTTISITPTSAANYMRAAYSGYHRAAAGGAGVNTEAYAGIARAGTRIGAETISGVVSGGGTNQQSDGGFGLVVYDNPNTASSIDYTLQHRGLNASSATSTLSCYGIVEEIMT